MTTSITCVPLPPGGEFLRASGGCILHSKDEFCVFELLDFGQRPDGCCTFVADELVRVIKQVQPNLLRSFSKDMTSKEADAFARELAGELALLHLDRTKRGKEARVLANGVLWFLAVSSLSCGVQVLTGTKA